MSEEEKFMRQSGLEKFLSLAFIAGLVVFFGSFAVTVLMIALIFHGFIFDKWVLDFPKTVAMCGLCLFFASMIVSIAISKGKDQ